jgi:dTDP-4-amino-4,6-dideoxygalactose transaminase
MPNRRLSLWPGLTGQILRISPVDRPAFPLGSASTHLFATARHGLYAGTAALGLVPGDEVLTPAYHHGSEVEALRQRGFNCRFYDVDSTLSPPLSEVESLVGPRTRALLLIHYFGFPQEIERWRSWCDERGLLLFEDVAQSFLASTNGRPLGSFGDLSIFCPYKTVGVPRVGLLHLPRAAGGVEPLGSGGFAFSEVVRLGAKTALARSMWLGSLGRWLESRARRRGESDDQALGVISGPSVASRVLLSRVNGERVASARRANYRRLLEELGHLVLPALHEVPSGATPLIFPVVSANNAHLIDHLRGQGILASRFWQHPHPDLEVHRYPVAADLRERIVALPIHQVLEEVDLASIASATRAAAGRGTT